ncbi:DUF2835 domain-containing protein [Woeseia oceani]|uniref:Topoisomerase II n=1 Tax=Woeseia oceani TaxID=1548547 RepID=A0A193LI66_9GAMM|nr:DUF2835 domain-containing protein [Woeseia oceani]ANO52084.1 hypothetical protein BA177_13535 [Woeseia oceani]
MNFVVVQLAIDSDRLLRLYQGSARVVVAVAENGQTVRFPANILREHVSHDGVHGRFRIEFAANGKFSRMSRLAS